MPGKDTRAAGRGRNDAAGKDLMFAASVFSKTERTERSEAIQKAASEVLDCFVASLLAMTAAMTPCLDEGVRQS
jgi:hypothetical protein